MHQLQLFRPHDKESLTHCLASATRLEVSLTLTDNCSTMLSARWVRGALNVRLHTMFLNATADVIEEAAAYMRGDKRTTPLVSAHIKQHAHMIRATAYRPSTYITRGKHHDLESIFNALNSAYFGGSIRAAITWGRRSSRRLVRRRTLGSYSRHANLIRINPVLDRRSTPLFFLQYVVYHEMLHADFAASNTCLHIIHSNEFRRREKIFKHYKQAVAWEKRKG